MLLCSKFWCRNRPGDEMDKTSFGVNALVMGEEDTEGFAPGMAVSYTVDSYPQKFNVRFND